MISEVVEFYVTEENVPKSNILYKKTPDGHVTLHNPSKYLLEYLESQGLIMQPDILVREEFKDASNDYKVDQSFEQQPQQVNFQNVYNNTRPNINTNQGVVQNRFIQPQPLQPLQAIKPKYINNQVNNN